MPRPGMLRWTIASLQVGGSATRICRKAAARASSVGKMNTPVKRKSQKRLHKMQKKLVAPRNPSVPPTTGPTATSSTPFNVAQDVPSMTALPPRPPLSKATLKLVTPEVLHSRLRAFLVQLVLLSPEPLRPSALYELYSRVVDAETANLFACASHAICLAKAKQSEGRLHRNADDVRASVPAAEDPRMCAASPPQDSEAATATEVSMEERRRIGRAFISAYNASLLPLVAALHQAEKHDGPCGVKRAVKGDAATAGASHRRNLCGVPACHDVAQWMLLNILFSDPEFRVSAYSGAVCYPTLPSLLLATSDRLQDAGRAEDCYKLQWTTRPAPQEATTSPTQALGSGAYLSQQSRPPQPSSANATTATRTAAGVAGTNASRVLSDTNFRWLNGLAGCPPWTLAHAEFVIYDAFVAGRPDADAAATVQARRGDGGGAAHVPALVADLMDTSGHRLVDYFILQSAYVRATGGKAALLHADKTAAKAFPALGWNEGAQGSSTMQLHAMELLAAEDGVLGFHLEQYARMRQPSGELYQANVRILYAIFRFLVSVPISVARLSTMLRWNLSVRNAGIYRSFFYLLLLLGANPTLHRLADGVQQRVRAEEICAKLSGKGGEGSSSSSVAEKNRSTQSLLLSRTRAEKNVRKGLLALTEPCDTQSSSLPQNPIEEEEEALAAAFAAEAELVRAPPLVDSYVVELLCLRVLPHARPGCAAQQHRSPSSFRGYPLQFVEVLPTWSLSPEEILNHLRAKHFSERGEDASSTAAPPLDSCWLESSEESHLLVCANSPILIRGRLKAAATRFSSIVASCPMTLRQLSIITLWAHEYGTEMATEMLFVLLQLNPHSVRLYPPSTASGEKHKRVAATASCNYGEWTVEFL